MRRGRQKSRKLWFSVRSCPQFCPPHVFGTDHWNICRSEFSEAGFELCIEDAADNAIYKEDRYIMQSIAWIWKELLVSVASRNGRIEGILSDIEDVDLSEDVFNYLKEDVGKDSSGYAKICFTDYTVGILEDKKTDGQSKCNGHWSPAMKIAARKVLDG